MAYTLLAVPSADYGSPTRSNRCRIYAREGIAALGGNALAEYRAHPELWAEVGIMGHDGRIICLETRFQSLQDDVPLAAGTLYPIET